MLVIETDDMRSDDLRWMPNVRRLIGRRGLSFENSFAPYPLCCPSRSSFLSGQYAHNHHVYTHLEPYGFAAFKDKRTIATVLQGAGYRTGLVGKYLNGYGEQYLRSGGSSLHYLPPGWDQWYAGSDHLWNFDDPHYGGGTYSYDHLVQNINGEIKSFPGQYSTDVVAEQARGVISGFEKSKAPWFVWWTPTAPHHGLPLESDDPVPSRRLDGEFSSWDTPGRPNWVKGKFDGRITHGSGTPKSGSAEEDTSDKPNYLRKLPELTSTEKDALTEVTRQRAESLYALDVQVRQTIRHLRKLGELKNTVIVFTSDNGYYLGEHRKRTGKINLHEPSLRVPLLIAGPGVPKGRRYDPVTTIDLAATFASYAGTTMKGTDGKSLLPIIRDGDKGWTPCRRHRGDDGLRPVRRAVQARSAAAGHARAAPRAVEADSLLHRGDGALRPEVGPAGAEQPQPGPGAQTDGAQDEGPLCALPRLPGRGVPRGVAGEVEAEPGRVAPAHQQPAACHQALLRQLAGSARSGRDRA